MKNDKLLLDIDVNGWIEDESGSILIDGDNVLVIPTGTASLFKEGETREYYVYTIGAGVPSIITKNLPDHIQASIKLAPGYSEKSAFKSSILTFEARPGTTEDDNEAYRIEIGFSTLSLRLSQLYRQKEIVIFWKLVRMRLSGYRRRPGQLLLKI
ncbi:MAG: hypothetical protein LIP01_04220 [Tannerellaceae bacterium]|nr:hypothetical protein [Tannerellaceae bacterium]